MPKKSVQNGKLSGKMIFFRRQLLSWYREENRPYPWKHNRDLYQIWLSEIMLQQTRTEQALPYYNRFINRFPTVEVLAAAKEDEVLELWQGLGYYSRGRNLLKAAKIIHAELGGVFPKDYRSWLKIPGVGPYTAAAITSFGYNQPNAVIDGNVYRILSRYFDVSEPIDTTSGKQLFSRLANTLLDPQQAGKYNQAIMDFGATVCKPKNPHCGECVLTENCQSLKSATIPLRPVKSRKVKKENLQISYAFITDGENFLLQKRDSNSIWPGMYEFPAIPREFSTEKWLQNLSVPLRDPAPKMGTLKHQLTHRNVRATFYKIHLSKLPLSKIKGTVLANQKNLSKFAVHQLIKKFFITFMSC